MSWVQTITIITSILIPFLSLSFIMVNQLIKHSKDIGTLEGAFFKEFGIKKTKKTKR